MQANLINGWREVLARIFDGFETEFGISPEWLINPETNRRLKLDYLFPDVGVAVRFVGLEGDAAQKPQERRRGDAGGGTRTLARRHLPQKRRGAGQH